MHLGIPGDESRNERNPYRTAEVTEQASNPGGVSHDLFPARTLTERSKKQGTACGAYILQPNSDGVVSIVSRWVKFSITKFAMIRAAF